MLFNRRQVRQAALLGGKSPLVLLPLVRGAKLLDAMGFKRASEAMSYINGVLNRVAVDVFRGSFDGNLMNERAGTNNIKNPWFVNAAVSNGSNNGTAPQGTSGFIGVSQGITRSIVGLGTVPSGQYAGLPYIDIQFAGTASGVSAVNFFMDSPGVAAANGEIWNMSPILAVIAGNPANLDTITLAHRMTDDAGTALGGAGLVSPNLGLTANLARYPWTATLNQANTKMLYPVLRFTPVNGRTYAETLRFIMGNQEKGGTPTAVMLPPQGTVAASTREVEKITRPLTTKEAEKGALLVQFMLPQYSNYGSQDLICLTNGDDANRILLRNPGGAKIDMARVVGWSGVASEAVEPAFTINVPFKVLLVWKSGRCGFFVAGKGPYWIDGTLPPITSILFGNGNQSYSNPINGQILSADLTLSDLTDAQGRALTA